MGNKYIYVYYTRIREIETAHVAYTLEEIPEHVYKVEKYSFDREYTRGGWQ